MRLIPKLILLIIPASSFAQQPKPVSGSIVRFENYLSQYVQPKNIDVWLPPGYVLTKKYAVLYMQDGQMLFDSSITWNKQEWQVDEHISALLESKTIMDCIVVAISNAGDSRQSEYFPYKPIAKLPAKIKDTLIALELKGKSQSDNYLLFLVKELKPYIDKQFPTFKDQRHTFIAGSSLGALMALYAICEYPRVFYGAACLSTHWPGSLLEYTDDIPLAFMAYLENHLPDPDSHRIYFDYGSNGLDSHYKKYQRMADKLMKEVGYKKKHWLTQEFPGEDHSENAWSKRLEVPLSFLLSMPDEDED
ncbi:MAG: alpha/beta hydrolase-fold protein [Ferruginibacter sp.]